MHLTLLMTIYVCGDVKRGSEFVAKEALNLACEFYSDNKLKRKDVRATKLVDFEGIAKHLNVNIMLYESKKESGQDAGKIRRLAYDKTQYKDTLPTINILAQEVKPRLFVQERNLNVFKEI